MTEPRPMRRRDREISREDAVSVIRAAHFAVLSTVDVDGRPYGVPVNAALCGDCLYFHSTKNESRKADNMRGNPAVCLTFTAYESRIDAEYTVDYASAVVEGSASLVTDEAEREKAFMAICNTHAAGRSEAQHRDYYKMQKCGAGAAIWRVAIEHISGKSRSWADVSKKFEVAK